MYSTSSYSDSEIIRNLAAGDDTAFSLLYEKYYAKTYGVAYKILRSAPQAEDVLQDVFIKIWNLRNKLTEIEDFNAYLNTVIRNHIFNQLRKKAHEDVFLKDHAGIITAGSNQTINDVLFHELDKKLHEAIAQLPPQQKKIFQMSRMYGLKQEEIAKSLKISLATVKKHMTVSLRFVRNYLSSAHFWVLILVYLKIF